MRIPLSPHGWRELLLYGGGLAAAAVLIALLLRSTPWVWAAVPFGAGALFVVAFFRDPERNPDPATGPDDALSPADGRIADIEVVDEPLFLKGQALRVGIFLSVFNVHVNRAPLDGEARHIHYAPGGFHDARSPRCIAENEANFVGFEGPRFRFGVKQIAGLIARRIVCPVRKGDRLARGDRMGLIKFGSRTELYVPADVGAEVAVRVGQNVRGGHTVLLRFPPK